MQYIIVSGDSTTVYDVVGLLLLRGWKVQGGVSAYFIPPGYPADSFRGEEYASTGFIGYAQALTHEDDDEEIPESIYNLGGIPHSIGLSTRKI